MDNGTVLPLVSIVTPTYQGGKYIEETIKSVQTQNYPKIEYIVIDGGSTDETASIAARYPDVINRFISEPDEGQADAIRKGFELATGEILAWLNADDVYEPGAISRIVNRFNKTGADVVYGDMRLIDESSSPIGLRRVSPLPRFGRLPGLISGSLGIYQPAAFWTVDLYKRVDGVDPRFQFAMDTDLIVKFAANGAKFEYTDDVLVNFRIHLDSKTSTLGNVSAQDRATIVAKWPAPSLANRKAIDLYARFWKLAYHVRKGRFRYLLNHYFDKEYRFVP